MWYNLAFRNLHLKPWSKSEICSSGFVQPMNIIYPSSFVSTAHTKQSLQSSSLQEMFYLYNDEDDYDYAGDIFGDNDEEEEDTYVEDEEDVEDCDEVT